MEKILDVIPNRYEAVRVMAKEARRINAILVSASEEIDEKPTTVAMKRVIGGKVKYAYEQREEEA